MAEKIFDYFEWQNGEAGGTPLNAANLNKLNNGIDGIDQRVVDLMNGTVPAGNAELLNGKAAGEFIDYAQLQAGLSTRVPKEPGKGLSTNDYTDADKENVDKIPDLVTDTTELKENLTQLGNTISDVWDSAKTYLVGDYCIYQNQLYRCITQCQGVLPTDTSYFVQTNVGNCFKALNTFFISDELAATGTSTIDRVFQTTGISLEELNKYKYAQIVLLIPSTVRFMASTLAIGEMLKIGYQVEAAFGTDGKLCCGMQLQNNELKYFAIGWAARIVLFN